MLNKSEVKYIQSLSQKKFREEEGLYLVEGPKIVGEALGDSRLKVKKLYAVKEWMAINEKLCENVPHELVADFELEKISQLKTANQVVALVVMEKDAAFRFDKEKPGLVLDGIQDPGNLGTIIRIADWFGVPQVICSSDSADMFNPKVVQSTMGSIFRVNIFYTDLSEWLEKQQGMAIYGAALDGISLKSIPAIADGLIVIGNESKGIRPGVMSRITQKITIDRRGSAESLNAAVAAGIILSHLR